MTGSNRVKSKGKRKAAGNGSAELELLRDALELSRRVHGDATSSSERKQLLLEGVCSLVSANRCMLAVTQLEPGTGRSRVLSVFTTDTTRRPAARGGRRTRVNTEPAAGGTAGRASTSADPSTFGTSVAGPSYVSYLQLEGVQLLAGLTVSREAGAARFTPRQRATVDVLLESFVWVFDAERKATPRPNATDATRRLDVL